jgi:hypothetical protein
VSYEWRRWVAVSLLRGMPITEVIATMAAADIPEELAAAICGGVLMDPTFEAAKWAMGQLAKLESVLDVGHQLRDLADLKVEVARRKNVTQSEFLNEYYSTNTPVLLEDVCADWPARTLWTHDYLIERLGHAEVEVVSGREDGIASVTRIRLRDYAGRMAAAWNPTGFLMANNSLLADDAAAPLWNDFTLDSRYLEPDPTKTKTSLWFGSAGAVITLQQTTENILWHQVDGWHHVVLIAPTETHRVSNTTGVYSNVDPLAPDLERFPRFAKVQQLQVTIGPGDALFIPAGWWHHVTALEAGISILCTSFVFPNSFEWKHPSVVV